MNNLHSRLNETIRSRNGQAAIIEEINTFIRKEREENENVNVISDVNENYDVEQQAGDFDMEKSTEDDGIYCVSI